MADAVHIPDEAETRARWGAFEWTPENAEQAKKVIARYPAGRQQSAVMPLLDLAQRQVGAETQTNGWLPVPVMEYIGRQLDMPYMRVYEVATFYTMYNLAPVGRYHVQVCGTTPCMLRGSDDVLDACYKKGLKKGATTADGLFTLTEVECLGACANAPMAAINDYYFEDLTPDNMAQIIDDFAAGQSPKPGSRVGRHTSEPEGGARVLTDPTLYDGSRAKKIKSLPNSQPAVEKAPA